MQHTARFCISLPLRALSVSLRPFRLLLLLSAHRFCARFSIFYPTFRFCPAPVYLDINCILQCEMRDR